MLQAFLGELFRPRRSRRRSNAISAVIELLEDRSLLAIPAPVVLQVIPPTSVIPDSHGRVPGLELQVIGLGFREGDAGTSIVSVNGNVWSTSSFLPNVLSASPLSGGSENGLKWGTNSLIVGVSGPDGEIEKSNNFTFKLSPAVPKITRIESNPSLPIIGRGFVLAIEGENFSSTSEVTILGGYDTSIVSEELGQVLTRSSTHILVGFEAVHFVGSATVTVNNDPEVNPFTRASGEIVVHYPSPTITSVTPESVELGGDGSVVHLTVKGTDFIPLGPGRPSSVVKLIKDLEGEGHAIVPHRVLIGYDTIELDVNASSLKGLDGVDVVVENEGVGGGPDLSDLFLVPILPATPSISALSVLNAAAGSAAKTIQIYGDSFADAVVLWGSTVLTPSVESGSRLEVAVPATLLATAGSTPVTVQNRYPAGNTISNATAFGVVDSARTITLSSRSKVIDPLGLSLSASSSQPVFEPGAVLQWNGVTIGSNTSGVAQNSIGASISASLVATAGTFAVTVVNPNGTLFGPATYTVLNPQPSRTFEQSIVGPVTVGTDTVLTLRGSDFKPGAHALLNGGGGIPTTFINSQTLEVTITADRLPLLPSTYFRHFDLTVENPAPQEGGTPDVWNFEAHFPTPTITSVAPPEVEAGSPLQTILITGTGFLNGLTRGYWESTGDLLPTRVVSDTQLQMDVSADLLAFGGSRQIRVATDINNGIGIQSNALTFDVLHPRPFISEMTSTWSPTRSSQPLLNDPTHVNVTFTGKGFSSTSSLRLEGASGVQLIPLSFYSGITDTQFEIALPLTQSVGSVTMSIVNPTPGGGTSNPLTFVFTRPRPRVTAVAERTFGGGISAGAPNTLISVTGIEFVNEADVTWNGVKLETTFVSATRLDATVPDELLRVEGTALVGVSGGDAPESAQPFGVPVSPFFAIISSISPDNAPPGSGGQDVTVNGNYFLDGAVAQWNGEPRPTTYVSGQQVTMTLAAADLAQVGSGTIRVVNPNGMTFGTRSFSVRNPLPAITSISPATVTAGSVTVPNVLSLTIHGANFGTDPFGMSVEINYPDNPNNFISQPTIIDSPTQMRVLIPADKIATARTAQIQIRQSGVGVSNRFDLVINNGSYSIVPTSAAKSEGNTATTPFTFTVTRSGVTTTAGSVDYTVTGSGSNAAEASDFAGNVLPSATINFATNQASKVVTINVVGDSTVEPTETFIVTLSNPTGAALGTINATGTMTNDDADYTIAAASATKAEGNTGTALFTFTVTRSGATTGAGSVKFAVTGSGTNSAVAADFGTALPSGTVNFAAGETSKLITVSVKGDTLFELDEGFTITLNTPVGGALGETTTANGLIQNDDSGLAIAATQANQAEGNSGLTPFTFTVIRGGATVTPATVKFAVSAPTGGASAADFGAAAFPSGTLNFAVGETSKTITLNVIGDTAIESNENFVVTLSAATGASLGTAVANGTIQTDDVALAIAVAPNGSNKVEGHSGSIAHTFTVTRTGLTTGTTSVDFRVAGVGPNPANEADLGGEFVDDVLEFAAGEIAKVITVNVTGDTTIEPTESFSVTLSNPIGASSLLTPTATGTIIADDSSFSIAPLSASKAEGNSGNIPFTFTITRNGSTLGAASVNFAITGSGDSPADVADFGTVFPTGLAKFATGATTAIVTINAKGDTTFEPDNGFTVTLSNPVGGVLAAATANGTILSDDATLTIAATDASKQEETSGSPTPFTFTVTRTGGINVPASAKFASATNGSGASATAASDFVGGKFPTGVVNFASGEATKLIPINVIADNLVEGHEGFKLTLSAPTGGAILGAAATITANGIINNDDASLSIAATSTVKVEGTGATPTAFTFTVTRTGDTSGISTATYTVTGAATTGANATDFGGSFPTGTVEFAATQTTQVITINVTADNLAEANEGFTVTLANASNAILGTTSATGTINNDDTSYSIAAQSATSANKNEGNTGNTAFTFVVTRIGVAIAGSVQFAILGSGDHPTDAADFANGTLPTGTLNFTAGQTSQTVTINIKADKTIETNETFTIRLLNPSLGITILVADAIASIVNDD